MNYETVFQLRRCDTVESLARKCLAWAQAHKLRIWWGRGKNDGSLFPVYDSDVGKNFVFSLWTNGKVELQFQYMSVPPFADLSMRQELSRRLNEIPGVTVPDDALSRRPTFELELLVAPDSLAKFLATCDWAHSEILKSETARLQANGETSP